MKESTKIKLRMLKAIEEAEHPTEAMLALYKLAVPDFDARTTVKPPKASYDTCLELINAFKNRFGQSEGVMMMWVNYGFGIGANMPDWEFKVQE